MLSFERSSFHPLLLQIQWFCKYQFISLIKGVIAGGYYPVPLIKAFQNFDKAWVLSALAYILPIGCFTVFRNQINPSTAGFLIKSAFFNPQGLFGLRKVQFYSQ